MLEDDRLSSHGSPAGRHLQEVFTPKLSQHCSSFLLRSRHASALYSHVAARMSLQVRAWDLRDGKCLAASRGHAGSVTALAFARSKPGAFLVSGGADKLLKVRCNITLLCCTSFSRNVSSVHPTGAVQSFCSDNHVPACLAVLWVLSANARDVAGGQQSLASEAACQASRCDQAALPKLFAPVTAADVSSYIGMHCCHCGRVPQFV